MSTTTPEQRITDTITPEPGSRLVQLQALYLSTKAAADEATAQHKAVTDAIKAELAGSARDGATAITLPPHGDAPALSLTYTETWRFDSKSFKAADPDTYVRYAKKSGSWTLRQVKAEASIDPLAGE